MTYYNDINPEACEWLRDLVARGLIAPGVVDCRSINEINADELTQYTQCHFFAGIGGWSLALRMAGWPDEKPVWTGSCPCQPLSCAGLHKGHADERHLWPAFQQLIAKRKPATVFGEQVASKDGREWLAAVRADMEATGYAVGAANLCAAGVGAPHIRQRIFWVASDTNHHHANGRGCAVQMRRNGSKKATEDNLHREGNQWATESRPVALAYGVSNRVALLNGYGNAIVPQAATEFISAFVECANIVLCNTPDKTKSANETTPST